jgi:dTDP-4-amino-4,6-dideoxygalactose transaminase
MKVPFMDLGRAPPGLEEAVLAAVRRVLGHRQYILGPEVEAFEALASRELEGAWAIGVSSGTDALLAILMALGIGPGDRVLTTPFSFFATAGVVRRLGARPVFADVEPRHLGLDPARVAELPPGSVKAAIHVHLFGHADDLDPIRAWCGDRVPLVEDAAQAIASRDASGRLAGLQGAAGAWSFFPTKNLGALGDAGLVATRDEELAQAIRRLRAHGQSSQYRHEVVGGNFRLDAIQAAALAAAWPCLPELNAARRRNAHRYSELFREAGLGPERIRLPEIDQGHTVHQFVVRIGGGLRDAVQERLRASGVQSMVYYPIPFHLQPCFRDLGHRKGDFPEAERAASEVLALPVFPGLTEAEQAQVVQALREALV